MQIDLSQLLAVGIKELKLSVPPQLESQLLVYVELLQKWNKAYNLTAVREPAAIVTHHILDSLAIVPYIHGARVLDVGSGAGLPGIPLALALPDKEFVLLDSNGKKTRFLNQAKSVLALKNVTIVAERAERYQPAKLFDTIICRAFASLAEIVALTSHLLSANGQILAMKGKYPEQELQEVTNSAVVHKLRVPGLDAERHLVCILPITPHIKEMLNYA
ncbi:MAG: 16S rRNA (guanine(527)-N(7))-methyltransferase RsmG [Gammaproteobacteria bacterium]|nr:16S rRNA (guanine(527)-N(7))-methyltransferase RsmG [Gammaproteobacteria bacterium]